MKIKTNHVLSLLSKLEEKLAHVVSKTHFLIADEPSEVLVEIGGGTEGVSVCYALSVSAAEMRRILIHFPVTGIDDDFQDITLVMLVEIKGKATQAEYTYSHEYSVYDGAEGASKVLAEIAGRFLCHGIAPLNALLVEQMFIDAARVTAPTE